MIKIDSENNATFEVEADDNCELCDTKTELRPYGPNNERICYQCGLKDWETTKRKMHQSFDQALASKGMALSDINLIDPNLDILSVDVFVVKVPSE